MRTTFPSYHPRRYVQLLVLTQFMSFTFKLKCLDDKDSKISKNDFLLPFSLFRRWVWILACVRSWIRTWWTLLRRRLMRPKSKSTLWCTVTPTPDSSIPSCTRSWQDSISRIGAHQSRPEGSGVARHHAKSHSLHNKINKYQYLI